MRVEKLRDTLYQQPFRPFTIHMADGRSFYVPHADFMAVSHRGRDVTCTMLTIGTTSLRQA